METSEFFALSEEDEKIILKSCKYTPEQIKERVEELKTWYKTQPHLPQTFKTENFLERCLGACFYNVKLTKRRIDLHLTFAGKNKDFYEMFGTEKFVLPSKNSVRVAILPKLFETGDAILAGHKNNGDDVEQYELDHFIQLAMAYIELGLKLSRSNGAVIVFDCEGLDIEWMKRTDVSKFVRLTIHLNEGYIMNIGGIHLLNVGTAITFFISLCRKLLPNWMFARLHIHDILESLHKVVEPKYLPVEFGGTSGSTKELMEKMDRLVLQNRDYLVNLPKFASDESKRASNKNNGSTFGVDVFF